MSTDLAQFLSALRWMSAWVVVVGHLRNYWFVPRTALESPSLLFDGLAWVAGFAHAGVMVFFVLSGYLVGGRALDVYGRNEGFARYLLDRVTRLHLVLLPSFVVAFLLLCLRAWFWGDWSILAQAENSARTLIFNIGFLQTVLAPVFTGNFPLWSLCNEFWYYVAAPLLIVVIAGRNSVIRVGSLLVMSAVFMLLGIKILLYLAVWLLGMVIRLGWLPQWRSAPAVAVWLLSAALVRTVYGEGGFATDFVQSLLLAVAIASFPGAREGRIRRSGGRNDLIANWSFSLYVLHVPIITTVVALIAGRQGAAALQPTVGNAVWFAAIFVLTLALSWLFASVTERHTDTFRKWMYQAAEHAGMLRKYQ